MGTGRAVNMVSGLLLVSLWSGHAEADKRLDVDASEELEAVDRPEGVDEPVARDLARRKTVSRSDALPSVRLTARGFATIGYAMPGEDLGSEVGATPQIFVSGISPRVGSNRGGFRSNGALMVGGERGRVRSQFELHFVGNALDPVLTEAKLALELSDAESDLGIRLIGGRYWWPFGIHDRDWSSQANAFPLVSIAAAEVVPARYNEVGMAVEGEYATNPSLGLNWIFSVGNGVPGFDFLGNLHDTDFDFNGNRTLTSRVGLSSRGAVELEAGISVSSGRLRAGSDVSLDINDARRYAATFFAFGPDVTLKWKEFALRSFYYVSDESFEESVGTGSRDVLARQGGTLEPSYTYAIDSDSITGVRLVLRISTASEDRLDGLEDTRRQWGAAVHTMIGRAFVAKLGFVAQHEADDAPGADNNVASISMTASF